MPSTTVTRARTTPRVSAAPDLLDWLRALLSFTFIVLLPMFIIGTSLRMLVTDRDLILRGFRENQVAQTTGLDQPQLEHIADAFVAYFQAPPGPIQMQVTAYGQSRPLFNDKEVQHMEDVQALIQFFLRMQLIAAAVITLRVLAALVLERQAGPLGRDMLISTGLMVALVALIGVLSFIDFDALWTRFHQIAFRNDLWQLDPSRDYLIMLFPEPFWLTATIRMAVTVALQTVVVAIIGTALVLLGRRG